MPLDRTDLSIIQSLQQNAGQRLEDIARSVKLATSSVHDRVRRLEREGVIRRWTIDVDADALGLGVLAFVGIRSSKSCAEMLDDLREISAIEECHSVAGEFSLFLKVRVSSTSALLVLIDRFRGIPGVESTETTIALRTQIDRPIGAELSIAPRADKPPTHPTTKK
jgi:Lrp/AsnC family transcriptional regulator, leucine-responsive regulatory protein